MPRQCPPPALLVSIVLLAIFMAASIKNVDKLNKKSNESNKKNENKLAVRSCLLSTYTEISGLLQRLQF